MLQSRIENTTLENSFLEVNIWGKLATLLFITVIVENRNQLEEW